MAAINQKSEDLERLPEHTLATVYAVLAKQKNLPDEKCVLSTSEKKPLSLKEMSDLIAAKFPALTQKLSVKETAPSVSTIPKRTCKLSEIESIFREATEKIKKYGRQHRVFLGEASMTCAIGGLLIQDQLSNFRFYPDSYRNDTVPAVVFKEVDELMLRFQTVATPSGVAKPATQPASAVRK